MKKVQCIAMSSARLAGSFRLEIVLRVRYDWISFYMIDFTYDMATKKEWLEPRKQAVSSI